MVFPEPHIGKTPGREQRRYSKANKREEMSRQWIWAEDGCIKLAPIGSKWPHQSTVGGGISSERCACCLHRTLKYGCRPVVKRMRERRRRMNPLQPVLL